MSRPVASVKVLATPVKAKTDKKDYRVLELSNGLRVLLISDTSYDLDKLDEEERVEDVAQVTDEEDSAESQDEEDSDGSEMDYSEEGGDPRMKSHPRSTSGLKKSAASLCVGMGSFSDPWELPGLAHFLEHMVFMGSKKYPDENHFDRFTHEHGGYDNAHTDCEHTSFYFETQRKSFHKALDIFAQFFIDPLMKKDAMQREREAVDSEFQMNLPSDSSRKQQIFGSLAKDGHPMTKFMWGNLHSLQMGQLSDDDVHKKLHEFWTRHYSANSMTLVVQSQETLAALQQLVLDTFATVGNNNPSGKEKFDHLKLPFEPPKFHRLYKVLPTDDTFRLDLTWALAPMMHEFRVKPLRYLSWLVGHEGRGSLISYLRKKVWALSLAAGNSECGFENNTTFSAFGIQCILTKTGFENIDDVLLAIFSYLRMLAREGASTRIFNEIKRIEELDFEFGPEPQPIENVEELSEGMQLYPPDMYLNGGHLMFDYDADLINGCIQKLTGDSVNLMLSARQYGPLASKIEPWFKTRFIDEDIPKAWIEAWKEPPILPEFSLPEPNAFIAENTSLLSKSDSSISESKYPRRIITENMGELYYRRDTVFNRPRAVAMFSIGSPLARKSLENAVCLDLMVCSLSQVMMEDTYAADQALLEHAVGIGERGEVTIKIDGLNDKLSLLLKTILDHISGLEEALQEDMFRAVKAQTRKDYYNYFINPAKLVGDVRLSILQDVHWLAKDKHSAINQIGLDKVKIFAKEFLHTSGAYVQGLVQGNVMEEEAVRMYEMTKSILTAKEGVAASADGSESASGGRCARVPEGSKYVRIKGFNPKDTNTLITNYYQLGPGNLKDMVNLEVACLILEEPVFDILRTKEQLGYSVFSKMRNTYGVLGVSVTVNSQATKFTADHVDSRIEAFLSWFLKDKLTNMTEEQFQGIVATLMTMKKAADVTLGEEVDRNWIEITMQDYLFQRNEESIKLLDSCTRAEVTRLIQSIIDCESNCRKKLSVQILGNPEGIKIQESEDVQEASEIDPELNFELEYVKSENPDTASNFVADAAAFKASLQFHPVIHIV